MKLVVLCKGKVYTDSALIHRLLSSWFLCVTVNWSEWSRVEWPVFRGFDWYDINDPQVPLNITPPVVFKLNLSPQDVCELIDLCLCAVREDLQHQGLKPQSSHFIHYPSQGAILRDGFICENVQGVQGHPFFHASPRQGSTVDKFIHSIRQLIPYGIQNRGMLLVRVTNFKSIPSTRVIRPEATPWHTDRTLYGTHIYSLSLRGVSNLVWSNVRDAGGVQTPVIVVPDLPGTMVYYSGAITQKPWLHMVPNTGQERISITWRPFPLNEQ